MIPLAVDPALGLVLRTALGLLFLWTATHKLRDAAGFRAALAAYELLPQRGVAAAAAMLSAAEAAIGVALAAPLDPVLCTWEIAPAAARVAAGLLCVYAGAIAFNLLRGRRHIDCGCIGAGGRRSLSFGLVVRNAVLVVIALVSALPYEARRLTAVDAVTIVAGVATMALLYTAVDGLMANAPRIALLAGGATRRAHVRSPDEASPGRAGAGAPLEGYG